MNQAQHSMTFADTTPRCSHTLYIRLSNYFLYILNYHIMTVLAEIEWIWMKLSSSSEKFRHTSTKRGWQSVPHGIITIWQRGLIMNTHWMLSCLAVLEKYAIEDFRWVRASCDKNTPSPAKTCCQIGIPNRKHFLDITYQPTYQYLDIMSVQMLYGECLHIYCTLCDSETLKCLWSHYCWSH
jgi:hypothetical protein